MAHKKKKNRFDESFGRRRDNIRRGCGRDDTKRHFITIKPVRVYSSRPPPPPLRIYTRIILLDNILRSSSDWSTRDRRDFQSVPNVPGRSYRASRVVIVIKRTPSALARTANNRNKTRPSPSAFRPRDSYASPITASSTSYRDRSRLRRASEHTNGGVH